MVDLYVNAPSYRPVDWSWLGNLPNVYRKAESDEMSLDAQSMGLEKQHEQLSAQNAFADGVPKDKNGNPDYAAIMNTLAQKGDINAISQFAPLAMQQQQLTQAQSTPLFGGSNPAGDLPPASAAASVPTRNSSANMPAPGAQPAGPAIQPASQASGASLMQIADDALKANPNVAAVLPNLAKSINVSDPTAPLTADQESRARRILQAYNARSGVKTPAQAGGAGNDDPPVRIPGYPGVWTRARAQQAAANKENEYPGPAEISAAQQKVARPAAQLQASGSLNQSSGAPGMLPLFAQTGSKYGVSPDYLARTAQLESTGDPQAKSDKSSARGLFQFTKDTARKYGLENPDDPVASTDAAARLAADNRASLAKALGRAPTDAELYLAHQQGAVGAAKLLMNPDAPAKDVVGLRAVLNNGGDPRMTAGQFAQMWLDKYNGSGGGKTNFGLTGYANPQGRMVLPQAAQTPPPANPFGGLSQQPMPNMQGSPAAAPPSPFGGIGGPQASAPPPPAAPASVAAQAPAYAPSPAPASAPVANAPAPGAVNAGPQSLAGEPFAPAGQGQPQPRQQAPAAPQQAPQRQGGGMADYLPELPKGARNVNDAIRMYDEAIQNYASSGNPYLAARVPTLQYERDRIAKAYAPMKVNPNDTFVDPVTGRALATGSRAGGPMVDNIVQGIASGDQPPTLTGLYGMGPAVRAGLEEQGVDLAKMQLEFDRAKKQVQTLNGPQMTRFVGLASSVVNTIDEVKGLSDKLQLSGVPILNRAQLSAYIQTQGNTPSGQLATRYMSAVNTLKEEFANLANGGYAPTEPAWKLADEQINGNFGVQQLNASLNEAQRLIKYRLNAMPGLANYGPGSSNRYMPNNGPANETPEQPQTQNGNASGVKAGKYRFNPQTGELEPF